MNKKLILFVLYIQMFTVVKYFFTHNMAIYACKKHWFSKDAAKQLQLSIWLES